MYTLMYHFDISSAKLTVGVKDVGQVLSLVAFISLHVYSTTFYVIVCVYN